MADCYRAGRHRAGRDCGSSDLVLVYRLCGKRMRALWFVGVAAGSASADGTVCWVCAFARRGCFAIVLMVVTVAVRPMIVNFRMRLEEAREETGIVRQRRHGDGLQFVEPFVELCPCIREHLVSSRCQRLVSFVHLPEGRWIIQILVCPFDHACCARIEQVVAIASQNLPQCFTSPR